MEKQQNRKISKHSEECFCQECIGDLGFSIGDGKDCKGAVRCSSCGRFHGYCHELLKQHLEESKMILPTPKSGNGNGGSLPSFLKVSDIPKKGTTTLVLGDVREGNSNFGAGINVDVTIGKKPYTFTVRFESKNYSKLHSKLGKNTDKWKGKRIQVERAQFKGGSPYVSVKE